MKFKNLYFVIIIMTFAHTLVGQDSHEATIKRGELNTFAQKGTKLFINCNCWDDNQFKQTFLTELGSKGIWRIVNNPQEADFVLSVNAWPRPYVDIVVYEGYALVFDNSGQLLYRSNLFFKGALLTYAPVDAFRRAEAKEIVNEGLLKEIPESKWIYSEPFDLLGYSKISEDKYKAAEELFWQGVDYFNQYNYKESINFFTNSLLLNPHNAFTYEYRAVAFYNLSKYKDARKDIIVAMKLDPLNTKNDTTYYNIMLGKNNKFMKTWGSGGTMDRINGALSAVNQSIATINNSKVGTTSEPAKVKQSTKESNNIGTKQQICTFCNGTGMNPAKERPVFYDYTKEDYSSDQCNVCGSISSHYHKQCPSCAGKGYKMVLTY